MSPGPDSWKETLLEASARAQEAVEEVRASGGSKRVVGVGASGDATLLADLEAEKAVVEVLTEIPGLRILSEEGGELGDRRGTTVAVVDPLDGSSNFERGIPFYCTSLAIVKGRDLRAVEASAVRNLVTGELYYAERGKGATKDGLRVSTSSTHDLASAVVGVDLSRTSREVIAKVSPLLTNVKRQVHCGANALELCLVAEGRIDASVDVRGRMRIVDMAGGYLIAREAGAVLTDEEGKDLNPPLNLSARFSFIASANRSVHETILRRLKARG